MEGSTISRWAFLIAGILAAVLIAERLTAILIHGFGISDSAGFLALFILYAILFFSVLSVKRTAHRIPVLPVRHAPGMRRRSEFPEGDAEQEH